MRRVKHYCENCGHAEKVTWQDNLVVIISSLAVALSILFILLLVTVGPVSLINMYVTGFITYNARINHPDEYREVAINLTRICDGDPSNKDCLAWALFYSLKDDYRYVPDSLLKIQKFDLEKVMNEGSDCKYAAGLYTTLARSIGVDARIECDASHCVSVIPFNNTHKTVVDLTAPVAYNIRIKDSWSVIKELDIDEYKAITRWI